MRNGLRLMAGFVELLAQAKFSGGLRDSGIWRCQFFAETVFTHHVGALVAALYPVFQRVEIRRRVKPAEILEAVIDKSHFIRPDDLSLLIDPYADGHVDHVVKLGYQMLPVD